MKIIFKNQTNPQVSKKVRFSSALLNKSTAGTSLEELPRHGTTCKAESKERIGEYRVCEGDHQVHHGERTLPRREGLSIPNPPSRTFLNFQICWTHHTQVPSVPGNKSPQAPVCDAALLRRSAPAAMYHHTPIEPF